MNIRQAGAREAGAQLREALFRHVERVQAAGRAHRVAKRERLAARAGAEVDDHLAAPRRKQAAEELAALVLYLDRARREQRVAAERRLALEAQPERRIRGWPRRDAAGSELRRDLGAGAFRCVHAQVERRWLVQCR